MNKQYFIVEREFSENKEKITSIEIERRLNNVPRTEIVYKVKQIPMPFELDKKRTGILKSPKEICEGASGIYFGESQLIDIHPEIGKRIEISAWKFPDSCYKDIKEEIDYSCIEVGFVIEVFVHGAEHPYYGRVVENNAKRQELKIFIGMNHQPMFSYDYIDSVNVVKIPLNRKFKND